MPTHIWQGKKPHHRADHVIQPGEAFNPTEEEQVAFADLLHKVGESLRGERPDTPPPPTEPPAASPASATGGSGRSRG